MSRWPTFLVLAPTGGGGDRLASALHTLPGVCMISRELNYFSTAWDRGAAWYASQFLDCGEALAVGEFSASYVRGSTAQTVAARIDGFLEDVRVLALVRHPASRAQEAFRALREAGRLAEGMTFERALQDEQDPWGLRAGSHYSHWLVPYRQRFGRRLLILPVEGRPEPGLAEAVLEHLELPADWAPRLQSSVAGDPVEPPCHGGVFDREMEALVSQFSVTFSAA